tara:strand:- start:168 stop:383 length:216 start_codon:yes stop_codon:yes gene_type:complete
MNNIREEINEIKVKIEKLEKTVVDLESMLESDNGENIYNLAKAIHEIQNELEKNGLYIVNKVYAPTKVGRV